MRKVLIDIYEDEPNAFGPASVSENPYKDLDDVNEFHLRKSQVKVKAENKQIKKRIFSCPRQSREVEAKIFYLVEAII